jgi:hypothetical protein
MSQSENFALWYEATSGSRRHQRVNVNKTVVFEHMYMSKEAENASLRAQAGQIAAENVSYSKLATKLDIVFAYTSKKHNIVSLYQR